MKVPLMKWKVDQSLVFMCVCVCVLWKNKMLCLILTEKPITTCERSGVNARFPTSWMDKAYPIAWPPRSLDLSITPLDPFPTGLREECGVLYSEKIRDIAHNLQQSISAAVVSSVTPGMFTIVEFFTERD